MNALPFLLAVAAALTLGSTPARAQSLRCGNDLVSVGDSRAKVLLRCGEPVVKDSFCRSVDRRVVRHTPEGRRVFNVLSCENVDEWTYNPGYGQFMTTFRFEEGTVTAITYGDRVK